MSSPPLNVLVLGGYGNFGARICRALAGDPTIRLLVAGRHLDQAQSMATSLGPTAVGIAMDHSKQDFVQQLRNHRVGMVVHTAGPFQEQGYGVALAAAQAHAHYIDLADGRRFVCDFPRALQAAFASAQRVAISGASTVPALSSAVVDHLCAGWKSIRSIDICIAPAQRAPRGQATLAGVLSYCGMGIPVWTGGQWTQGIGWAKPTPVTFERMKPRVAALCDIPDLELFPEHYRVQDRVDFRAALEVGLAQYSFSALSTLRQWGILKHPEKLAGLLHRTGWVLDSFGTPLGGMVVRVEGTDAQSNPCKRAWHIAADHDYGPEIPCMATILLVRQMARGQCLAPGAYTSTGLVSLAAFAPEFAKWGMVTDVVQE